MIRNFISVMRNGTAERHDEPPTHLIRVGATIIEISPELAAARVRVFVIDEDGARMREIP